MIELAGHKFETLEIIRRVVMNMPTCTTKGHQKMRWVRVQKTFGMGSTVSYAICKELGLDPEEYI